MVVSNIFIKRDCDDIWETVFKEYAKFFREQTYYDIFMFAMSIGILHDKTMIMDEKKDENAFTIPATVIINHDRGRLDEFFITSILTSNVVDLTEEERIVLAFAPENSSDEKGDTEEFSKIEFLKGFANYGANELYRLIGASDMDTMVNLKEYLDNLTSIDINELRLDSYNDLDFEDFE